MNPYALLGILLLVIVCLIGAHFLREDERTLNGKRPTHKP